MPDPYRCFRSPYFRFLIAGTFLSTFGLQMLSVAVSWDLYMHTRSAVVLGNVGFVQVAPFIVFALFAGQFADRYDRKLIVNATQALLLLSSALLLSTSSVAGIFAVLFLNASARAFQAPARLAILPQIVPPHAISEAITWNSSFFEVATVTGPALGGILIATAGSKPVYMVQCACAALTLFCFYMLRLPAATPVADAPGPRKILEGLKFVGNHRLILPAISLDLFGVLFGGATALLPIYAVDILHVGPSGLGWLRAAPSIGAILMALTMAHRPQITNAGRVLLCAVAGFGLATVVFGFSRSFWLSLAMLALTGAFDNISVVLRQSLVQSATPDYLKGRVFAVNSIFVSCSNQLGAVESGWTAAWLGPVASVAGGGFATLAIVALFAAGSSSIRNWKQKQGCN